MPYDAALARQRRRRDRIIAGRGGECLALLEHRAVVTVGRRPAPGTPAPSVLAAAGIDYCRTERGGLATWHGPGQLVGYVLLDVAGRGLGVKGLVHRVEQGLIDWLGEQGLVATRRCGFPGAWIGDQKLAAVGFHFRRGVSLHGFALNLSPSLDGFAQIVPCGLRETRVGTVADQLGVAPEPAAAAAGVARSLLGALGLLDG